MLVLAASPGDETLACGSLIAEACARGRPPLVAILSDGASLGVAGLSPDARAVAHERETRAAVQFLGLPPGRLLALGVRDSAVPAGGAFFEQIVDAVGFLSWMRDLDVICAPHPDTSAAIPARAAAIAAQVAQRAGIERLSYGAGLGAGAWTLPVHAAAKARAAAAHASLPTPPDLSPEWFMPWHGR